MKQIMIALCALLLTVTTASYAKRYRSRRSYTPKVNRTLRYNVRLYVPELLLGSIGAAFDYKWNNRMTVGPLVRYYAYGSYSGYHIGAQMSYVLKGLKYGSSGVNHVFGNKVWLLQPHVEWAHSDIENTDSGRKNGLEGGVNLAYQWMWKDGINLQLYGGALYTALEPLIGVGKSHITATAGLTLGYAF